LRIPIDADKPGKHAKRGVVEDPVTGETKYIIKERYHE
jgi:hypothetical protein